MPFKSDKLIKFAGTQFDRRRKLTEEQKAEIIKDKTTSINSLAKRYNVSRRTIQFLRYPDRRVSNLLKCQEKGGSKIYYDREKHTIQMRELRRRKREVYLLHELNILGGLDNGQQE